MIASFGVVKSRCETYEGGVGMLRHFDPPKKLSGNYHAYLRKLQRVQRRYWASVSYQSDPEGDR